MNCRHQCARIGFLPGVALRVLASLWHSDHTDLIGAILKDSVQTLMIIIGLVVLLIGGSVWGLIECL